MGQQASRDAVRGEARTPAERLRSAVDRSVGSSSTAAHAPSAPRKAAGASGRTRAVSSISADTRVDGGYVVGQGVYKGKADYNVHTVRSLIVKRKLAPFFKPVDENAEDDGTGADDSGTDGAHEESECPICFLIQRVDPKHTVPPSSQPAMCPFCVTPEFGVVYDPPEATDAPRNTPKASAQTAIECAETAVGTGGASTNGRTSYPADHPRVVLVDTVHPDWHSKLEAALEAQARQANRRMILRQVGDTLVPIGVSSSRTGETLANAVSHNARLGHNGPGGSIILHQNARVADLELDGAAPRSSSLSSSLPGPLQRGLPFSRFRSSERRHHPQIGDSLARSVMHLTPYEMEQLVLHETLRVSREEAEARARAEQAEARAPRSSASVPPRTTTEQRSQRSPETRRSSGAHRSPETRRTPRLSFDLSRFRSSSEQPRARSSLDTARVPHSPGARRTPHSPEARRAPSRAGAFEAADTVRAPSPIEEAVPAPGAAASSAAAPSAAAPSAAAPSNATPSASQSAAPPSLAPALVLQSPSPTLASPALPRTSVSLDTDRAASPVPSQSPVAARAPVHHPATPETQRMRSTSNTPVNLSKSVMDDLQQLSGDATPPARHSPSTNPFRRRMDAAAP